jgi:branched-chain amino acid transport system substrate-binding protein
MPKQKENQKKDGIVRRDFLKATAVVGTSIMVPFGVPTLLRAAPKPIKIGSIQPVTGPLAVIGQGQRKANLMAAKQINAAGGIKSMDGAKLEILLGDSESKPEVGRQEADRLLKEGAVALQGPFQSGTAMAIATLAEQRQVPFVMDVAALDAITQKGFQYSYRVFITAGGLVGGALKYLKQVTEMKGVQPKTAVVTNTADPFGKGMSGGFLKGLEKSGMPIKVLERIQYPLGTPDLSAEVAKIKSLKPDLIFPVSRPGDSVLLTRELYKQRVSLMGIFCPGSPGWYEPHVLKDLDKLILYVLVNVPWINPLSSVYQQANAAFQKEYDQTLDTNSAYAYTGTLVMADALERAGSVKADDIVAALKKTNFEDHPVLGGPIQFAENGDNKGALTGLLQIQPDPEPANRAKVVLPKEFAQSQEITFPWPQLWER